MTRTFPPLERESPARITDRRRIVRWRLNGRWVRIDLRVATVCAALGALTVSAFILALTLGEYPLAIAEVWRALSSGVDDFTRTVVVEWRMPRALASVTFGAALAVAGAVFQSLTRNPLASPDIIGFSTGSYTGALIVLIVTGGGYLQVAAGSLIGGILTALLVYLLAFRRGVQGFRLIIVGIAISAVLSSINSWLMLTAKLETAMSAAVWGAGSLNGTTWLQASAGSGLVLALLIPVAFLSRRLRQLELGDDAAQATGVSVEATRLAFMTLSVALVAVVTAAAGPIAFVAFAAPQIARRLVRTAGISLTAAAFMGALLLAASDLAAQHLLPVSLPVGLVTVVIGGGYLIWLLISEARKRQ